MKYFTKYLPVDGEIKKGDWILANGKPEQVTDIQMVDTPQYKTKTAWWSTAQKVKLFLCSRDIKVGDTFKIDVPGIPSHLEDRVCTGLARDPTYGTRMYLINETGAHLKDLEAFKVIGEVSPAALWVTEGMEFDEEEVKQVDRHYLRDEETKSPATIKVDDHSKSQYVDNYWIKCPTCGHFH